MHGDLHERLLRQLLPLLLDHRMEHTHVHGCLDAGILQGVSGLGVSLRDQIVLQSRWGASDSTYRL